LKRISINDVIEKTDDVRATGAFPETRPTNIPSSFVDCIVDHVFRPVLSSPGARRRPAACVRSANPAVLLAGRGPRPHTRPGRRGGTHRARARRRRGRGRRRAHAPRPPLRARPRRPPARQARLRAAAGVRLGGAYLTCIVASPREKKGLRVASSPRGPPEAAPGAEPAGARWSPEGAHGGHAAPWGPRHGGQRTPEAGGGRPEAAPPPSPRPPRPARATRTSPLCLRGGPHPLPWT
jgi:hypothetical protein